MSASKSVGVGSKTVVSTPENTENKSKIRGSFNGEGYKVNNSGKTSPKNLPVTGRTSPSALAAARRAWATVANDTEKTRPVVGLPPLPGRRKRRNKRTNSTEGPPAITTKPPSAARKPTPKTKSVNFLTQLKNVTGKINRSKETVVESQAPPAPPKKNNRSRNSMNGSKTVRRSLASKFEEIAKQNSSETNSKEVRANAQTPPTTSQPTTAPSQTQKHRESKKQGSENRAEERKKRWEQEGPPAIRKALEPLFNQIAKQKNTPPGITKTNVERLLQPFKQPVTVTVAPTISVKGGSAKATGGSLQQTQIQYKTPANKKKKPLKLIRSPETMRKEKSAAFRKEITSRLRSPVVAKRREALYNLRTPTVGQRKTHVIQLIDRVLRRMKAPKDAEKKLIKFYEGLSEKQIKSLFGGRSPEFVKNTLKKQIDYLKKKKR